MSSIMSKHCDGSVDFRNKPIVRPGFSWRVELSKSSATNPSLAAVITDFVDELSLALVVATFVEGSAFTFSSDDDDVEDSISFAPATSATGLSVSEEEEEEEEEEDEHEEDDEEVVAFLDCPSSVPVLYT